MPRELGIPIKLDRPRTLLLDAAAFDLIRESTGIDLAEAMKMALNRDGEKGFPMTLEITQDLILAGCAAEDSRLTLEKVKQFVTAENYESFHEDITKAIMRGAGISYKP